MRIAAVGHSLAHIRQQNFFRHLAVMGHDVLLCCPDRWGALKPEPYKMGYNGERYSTFEITPLQVIGGSEAGAWNMYTFRLVGLDRVLRAFRPDAIYVQQEAACALSAQIMDCLPRVPRALFVWENLEINHGLRTDLVLDVLNYYDLLVCGNDQAAVLHPHRRKLFLPQVGVDTVHFTARPEVERAANVGYIGRPVREKGIEILERAYPEARITPWTEWTRLPWALSAVKVIACPSLDTRLWHEQAGPYAAWEAMSCGCAVVVSDAGAIPWWNGGGFCEPCKSLVIVKQGDPADLRRGILEALSDWRARGEANRAWVQERLDLNPVARTLIKELEAL